MEQDGISNIAGWDKRFVDKVDWVEYNERLVGRG